MLEQGRGEEEGRRGGEEERGPGEAARITYEAKAVGSHLMRGSDKISLAVSNSDWHLQVEEPAISAVEIGEAGERYGCGTEQRRDRGVKKRRVSGPHLNRTLKTSRQTQDNLISLYSIQYDRNVLSEDGEWRAAVTSYRPD